MMSNQLALAKANADPHRSDVYLPDAPTNYQVGALVALEEIGYRTNLSSWREVGRTARDIGKDVRDRCSKHGLIFDHLGQLIDTWNDQQSAIALGYWLTRVRQSGMTVDEAQRLTHILIDKVRTSSHSGGYPSVRRYPTGAVSEKQAIVLPAVLRFLSEEFQFISPFLVARRLGHTGGTRDKLSALAGFRIFPSECVRSWTSEPPRIRYITADQGLCPRDEVLYYLRGHTGTVVDTGLIAASICAKQYVARATTTLIDVLFGAGAFLETRADAEDFVNVASQIAAGLNLDLIFRYRSTLEIRWKSVGNVAEVYEIVDDLKNLTAYGQDTEIGLAIEFSARLLSSIGYSSSKVESACAKGLADGRILESLGLIWREHGVAKSEVDAILDSPWDRLLGGMNHGEVTTMAGGILSCSDVRKLADLVNTELNGYQQSVGLPELSARGGILLETTLGSDMSAGSRTFSIFSQNRISEDLIEEFAALIGTRPAGEFE